MTRISRRSLLGLASAVPLASTGLLLPRGASAAQRVFAEGGIAVRGADVVAYVTEGRPMAGNAAFVHAWGGVTWRFATAANRDLFAADPERYAPAYGGFCAWAVAQGYTASIDPRVWRIVDGRLFLNYSASVQRQWERDIPGNIAKADANWPRLAAK
jgi:hypothetical protein